jgi:hypothetical protein
MTAQDVDAAFGTVIAALTDLRTALVDTLTEQPVPLPGPIAEHTHAGSGWGPWLFAPVAGANDDPGAGHIHIKVTSGEGRLISVSHTDAAAAHWHDALSLLQVGDSITVNDDPTTGPVTAWSVYLVRSEPVDHGTYTTFKATRVAVAGQQVTLTPAETSMRVYLGVTGHVV